MYFLKYMYITEYVYNLRKSVYLYTTTTLAKENLLRYLIVRIINIILPHYVYTKSNFQYVCDVCLLSHKIIIVPYI